jgi:hypothetical protein
VECEGARIHCVNLQNTLNAKAGDSKSTNTFARCGAVDTQLIATVHLIRSGEAQSASLEYSTTMTPIEKATTPVEQTTAEESVVPTLSPARVHTIVAGLWLCLFVSAMDTTIVTTALIKISSGFNALEQGAWLVTAYLLTYNCE